MTKIIYNEPYTGEKIEIAEILTNMSLTVDEALKIAGVDLDEWADARGWDGYDFNQISLEGN